MFSGGCGSKVDSKMAFWMMRLTSVFTGVVGCLFWTWPQWNLLFFFLPIFMNLRCSQRKCRFGCCCLVSLPGWQDGNGSQLDGSLCKTNHTGARSKMWKDFSQEHEHIQINRVIQLLNGNFADFEPALCHLEDCHIKLISYTPAFMYASMDTKSIAGSIQSESRECWSITILLSVHFSSPDREIDICMEYDIDCYQPAASWFPVSKLRMSTTHLAVCHPAVGVFIDSV